MFYLVFFIGTPFLMLFLTLIVREIAIRYSVFDYPDQPRKQHNRPTPLLGGIAIFIALALSLYGGRALILSGNLLPIHWLGVLAGALALMIGGRA